MEPQYPVGEPIASITKPPLKLKNIEWQLGKGMFSVDPEYAYISSSTLNEESQLDKIETYCQALAWVRDCMVAVKLTHFDGSISMTAAEPDEFTGELDVTITTNISNSKPRFIKTRISDTERLDGLIIDRFYMCDSLMVTISLPGDDDRIDLFLYNPQICTFDGPRATHSNVRGQQAVNYRESYEVISQVIKYTNTTNFDATTGLFTYVLMNFNILDINQNRLEAALHRSGWTHVKFIKEPQYTLLELK